MSLHGTPDPAAAWKMQPDGSTGITIKVGRQLKAWNKKSNQIKNKNKTQKHVKVTKCDLNVYKITTNKERLPQNMYIKTAT